MKIPTALSLAVQVVAMRSPPSPPRSRFGQWSRERAASSESLAAAALRAGESKSIHSSRTQITDRESGGTRPLWATPRLGHFGSRNAPRFFVLGEPREPYNNRPPTHPPQPISAVDQLAFVIDGPLPDWRLCDSQCGGVLFIPWGHIIGH